MVRHHQSSRRFHFVRGFTHIRILQRSHIKGYRPRLGEYKTLALFSLVHGKVVLPASTFGDALAKFSSAKFYNERKLQLLVAFYKYMARQYKGQ